MRPNDRFGFIIALKNAVTTIAPTKVESYNVYTIDGCLLMKDAKSLKALAPGIYIVNGKKTVIQ